MTFDNSEKTRFVSRPTDWTDVLAPEIISQFLGKHIAIVYKRVVASGTSFDSVFEECVKLFPDETPYMAYIPTPEEADDEAYNASVTTISNEQPAPLRVPIVKPPKPGGAKTDSAEAAEQPFRSSIRLFTPESGAVGAVVTVIGTDFASSSEVKFGEVSVPSFTLLSETSLSVLVPAGATTDYISIITPQGIAKSKNRFIVLEPPSVESFTPKSGAPGTKVTINGFFFSSASSVVFEGGVQSVILSATDRFLITEVPFGAKSGPVTVHTPLGSATSANSFTVPYPPHVSSYVPDHGCIGSEVTFTGVDLDKVTSVKFAGVPAAGFSVKTSESVTAIVPVGVGDGPISLSTPGGVAVVGKFTVVEAPSIASAHSSDPGLGETTKIHQPKVGSTMPEEIFSPVPPPSVLTVDPPAATVDSVITLFGANLSDPQQIAFNDVLASDYTAVSQSIIQVKVPPGAVSGPVTVTTLGGTSSSPARLTVIPEPGIKTLTPASGGIGSKVMITGTNLSGVSQIKFRDVIAPKFTVISQTFVSVEVPVDATTGLVSVTTLGGTADSPVEFVVIQPPTISNVSPNAGPAGTKVTITGDNLTGAAVVTLNDQPVDNFWGESPTSIVTEIGENAENGIFKVTTDGGTAESVSSFTVIPLPTIHSFSPVLGPAGTVITVCGTNLDRANVAYVNQVRANVTSVNPFQAKIFVPNDATSGVLSIMTPYGLCDSNVPFEVISSSSIKDIIPSSGIAGSMVTINGWGFRGATGVFFGGIPSPSFSVQSNHSITSQIPHGAATGSVRVETPTGTAVWPKDFTVTFSLHEFQPPDGASGTLVTLSGIGFTGTTNIDFAGVSAEYRVLSNTSIKTRAPAPGVDGFIRVQSQRGTALSPNRYYFPPTILNINPNSGPPGTLVTIKLGKNIDLATEEFDVEFSPAIKASPIAVNSLDHLIYAEVPPNAISGAVQVRTAGGISRSQQYFEVIDSSPNKSVRK